MTNRAVLVVGIGGTIWVGASIARWDEVELELMIGQIYLV